MSISFYFNICLVVSEFWHSNLVLQSKVFVSSILPSFIFLIYFITTGKEYFGLENSMLANAPPTWLPFQTLDLLVLELEEAQDEDDEYEKVRIKKFFDFSATELIPCKSEFKT